MSRIVSITGRDLVFRSPANWTAVGFFAALGCLHLGIVVPAFVAGRWEGYLSGVLAVVFLAASAAATRFRFELAVLRSSKRLRMRTGIGRLCVERQVPFSAVHGVRLTWDDHNAPSSARIELLCPYDDVQCPPTRVPRQQALFLAMLLGVPLIKVSKGKSNEHEPTGFRNSDGVSTTVSWTSPNADLRSGG